MSDITTLHGRPIHDGQGGNQPTPITPLRDLPCSFLIGAAYRADDATSSDPDYDPPFRREFNSMTPENKFKQVNLNTSDGVWGWTAADLLVTLSETNAQAFNAHALVYQAALPTWIIEGGFSAEQLSARMEDHVRAVVGRYTGRIATVEVVNEVWDVNGDFRTGVLYDTIGEDYAKGAFAWAAAEDPNAVLMWNGNEFTQPGAGLENAITKIGGYLDEGIPIHAVGIQLHLKLDVVEALGLKTVMGQLNSTFKRFAALGLDIHITECDIAIDDPSSAAKRYRQAQWYAAIIHQCKRQPAIKVFTMWGFTAKYSWITRSSRLTVWCMKRFQQNRKCLFKSS